MNEVYTPIVSSNTDMESAVVSFTYPIVIFYVDISSRLFSEASQEVNNAFTSCLMQGSILIGERKKAMQYSQNFSTMLHVPVVLISCTL